MMALALYVVCGLISLGLSVWISPDTFDPDARALVQASDPKYKSIYLGTARVEVAFFTFVAVVVWPIFLVGAVMGLFRRYVLHAKRERQRRIADLEAELGDARKEVDRLLRSL